jgi:DNA-binding transcriptional LysR family regulator
VKKEVKTPRAFVPIKNSEQGVQSVRPAPAPDARPVELPWDDLRFFLSVATRASLRAAAEAEGVSVNTVRARMEKLERRWGAPLLRRSGKGSFVTEAGEDVLRMAREMQAATVRSGLQPSRNVLVSSTELRISCSEGLGLLWLTPRLAELRSELTGLAVNFRLDYDLSRDRSSQVDLALTFVPPSNPDMIVTRIATLHFMMFASEAYLRTYGAPSSPDEVKAHTLVEQVTPGVNSSLIDLFLGTERPAHQVGIRTNSSLAQLWAVANGSGIAPMPTYVRAITRSVIPIPPPLNLRFDLFCAYHASARGSPAVMSAMAWLRRCFDPGAYPWFRSDFVDPTEFPFPAKGGRVVSLFDNLIDPVAR